jgi:hypothetical protein
MRIGTRTIVTRILMLMRFDGELKLKRGSEDVGSSPMMGEKEMTSVMIS